MMRKTGDKNVCLLHGWGANTEKLKNLGQELTKLGWSVFIAKIPFFDAPEAKKAWSLADFSAEIEKQTTDYFKKEPYFLFGHSFGGRIAIYLAAKPAANLKGIILCSTAGISRTSLAKRSFFIILSKGLAPFKKLFPSLTPSFKKITYRLARASDYSQISSEVKKETFRQIIAENLKDKVHLIKIPTLILWGELDKVTPLKDAYFFHSKISSSVLKSFPDEGHCLPYHQPDRLAKEINLWYESL